MAKSRSLPTYVFSILNFSTRSEANTPQWTNRVAPYSDQLVGEEIFAQYFEYPVLFGGNTGSGQFDVISGPAGIQNGKFNATSAASVSCLLYQLATERIPSSLNGFVTPTADALAFAVGKLGPGYANLGCSTPLD